MSADGGFDVLGTGGDCPRAQTRKTFGHYFSSAGQQAWPREMSTVDLPADLQEPGGNARTPVDGGGQSAPNNKPKPPF